VSDFTLYALRGLLLYHLLEFAFYFKLTTYEMLEKIDIDNIKFITLRRRGKKLIENANNIPDDDWIKVDLKKENRKFNKFKMHENEIILPRTNFKVVR